MKHFLTFFKTPLAWFTLTLGLLSFSNLQLHAERLLEESFENFDSNNKPVGWDWFGAGNHIKVVDEVSAAVNTPYGEHVLSTYNDAGNRSYVNRVITLIPNDDADAVGGSGDYIMNFNIACRGNRPKGEYRAELWVIPFAFTGMPPIMVAHIDGDTDGSKDFSYTDQLSWRYEYQDWESGGYSMIAGAELELRLMMSPHPDRDNWQHAPLWDNVTADYEPDIDNEGPSVTDITDDNEGLSVVATNATVTYTVNFSETVDPATVDASDFKNAGGANATIQSVSLSPDNTSAIVEIIPTGSGTLRLAIVQGTEIADPNGNLMDTSSSIQDDVTFNVVSGIPTIRPSDFVDDQVGGTIAENTLVTYTLTFSTDMNAGTVTDADFSNAGTASIAIGAVTETSPGVFTVEVTPTNSGTLQLRITQGVLIQSAGGSNLDTSSAIADDTTLVVDSIPPTITDIIDDAAGSPVAVGALLSYDIYFSEAMDTASIDASDFGNAVTTGAASFTIDTIGEASPGVTRIEITPTSGGSIQLQVNSGATLQDRSGNALDTTSPIIDNVVVTVESTSTDPFDTWSGGSILFGDDANKDGVPNGIAWLLGANDANENALPLLPNTSVTPSGDLVLSFRCLKTANRGTAVAKVQFSNDMGVADAWADNEAEVPDTNSTVNGIVFETTDAGDYVDVTATIPASAAGAGNKLFARFFGEAP